MATDSQPEPSARKPKRRWLQFSISSLLLLITLCGVGLALMPVLSVVAALGDEPASDPPQVSAWVDRANIYAKELAGTNWHFASGMVACFYVRLNQLERAREAASEYREERHPYRGLCVVADELAVASRTEEAIRIADEIPDEKERDYALMLVATRQIRRHEFEALKTTIQRMKTPDRMEVMWYDLGETLAKAGHYDEALRASERIVPTDEFGRNEKRELLELIATSRAEGRHDKPEVDAAGLIERYRSLNRAFVGGEEFLGDVAKAKKAAEEAEGDINQAPAWTQLAWAHIRRGETDEARMALGMSLQAARTIELRTLKSQNLVLVADAFFEIGDREAALRTVGELPQEKGLFRGLVSLTKGPLVVSVLIRCGKVDEAFRSLSLKSFVDSGNYEAFGAVCALEGKIDEVEKRLADLPAGPQAFLCLGVASGLEELQLGDMPAKP